ncbi:MAG: HD domain-containing protein [Bacilli bacterium]|nr:HD domain-containing protein [Bacilli bacterium]
MEFTFYTAATILLIVLMVAMTIHVLRYSGFNKEQKAWFAATFGSITFCALAEFAVHCGVYDFSFKIPLTILTVLQFAIAPCFAMLFAGALGLRNQGKIAFASFGFCLLIGIICAPFGWEFYFDAEGYHRGVAFLVYEITYIASLIYIVVALFLVGKKFHHRDSSTIIMILVVLAAGVIPMTLASMHIAYIAVGISACLCYVYYNDLVQQDIRDELVQNQEHVSAMQTQIIARLANLIESRDTETGGHVARTSAYCKLLAEDSQKDGVYADTIDKDFIDRLYAVAPIHDVGKILVSDKILRKPGKLTPEEFEEMKKHAASGGDVAKRILTGIADDASMQMAYDIATYHHERWGGGGYPHGLQGEEIPLSARIMAIADVFDALVSKRCYKEPIPLDEAFHIIESDSGTHFDPKLVEVFLKNKDQYVAINASLADKEG